LGKIKRKDGRVEGEKGKKKVGVKEEE